MQSRERDTDLPIQTSMEVIIMPRNNNTTALATASAAPTGPLSTIEQLQAQLGSVSGPHASLLRRAIQGEIKRIRRGQKASVRRADKRAAMTVADKAELRAKRAVRRENNRVLLSWAKENMPSSAGSELATQ